MLNTILIFIVAMMNIFEDHTPELKPAITQETLDKLQLYVSPKSDSTTVEAVFTDKTGKTVSISKTFKNEANTSAKLQR